MDKRTKEFGDFFTPVSIADKLASWSEHQSGVQRVLDPCAGSGRLIWPLLRQAHKVEVTAVEVQTEYLAVLVAEAQRLSYDVEEQDGHVLIRNWT